MPHFTQTHPVPHHILLHGTRSALELGIDHDPVKIDRRSVPHRPPHHHPQHDSRIYTAPDHGYNTNITDMHKRKFIPLERETSLIEEKNVTAEEPDAAGNEAESQPDDEPEKEAPQRPTYLFLIRHGENEWTERGALAGRTPAVPLNEKGREQAHQVAERLKVQPITAVYSSPLLRCLESAQPLAAALNLSISVEPGVLEVDYGEWRGGELKELSKRPEWQLVQIFPGGFRFPGGETLREVQNRVVTTLERIRTEHAGEVVAVYAHGDVLRTTLAYYLGTPLDLFQRIQISTASISVVAFHRFGPSILAMNDSGGFPVIKLE